MPFSCYVVGEGPLPVECTRILLERGFQVRGLITAEPTLRQFADEHQLPCFPYSDRAIAEMAAQPFDFLFSIVNGQLLPEAVLNLPRRLAVNYHDSLLPAYAGVHATFWAILNGESRHGVTWHRMDAGIDTGEVLMQQAVAVAPDETSLSLNLKCFQAGQESFARLLDALLSETVSARPQNPTGRSFYSRRRRPSTFIDWQRTAEEIWRQHRALEFGFHPNPFGKLKLRLENELFLVEKAEPADRSDGLAPGTIEAVALDHLRVAAASGALNISALQALDGQPVELSILIQRFTLKPGVRLLSPEPAVQEALRQADAESAPYRTVWTDRLARFEATEPPFTSTAVAEGSPEWMTLDLPAPGFSSGQQIGAWIVYLSRVCGTATVGTGYRTHRLMQTAAATGKLFGDVLPNRLEIDPDAGFRTVCASVDGQLQDLETLPPFPLDLIACEPALRGKSFRSVPVILTRLTEPEGYRPAEPEALHFVIHETGSARLVFSPRWWNPRLLAHVPDHWQALLNDITRHPDRPVGSLSLLTDEQRHRQLVEWNRTPTPYPDHRSLPRLVEQQAGLRPEAVALRFETESWTYRQLNEKADLLADRLQLRGIGPGQPVGICLERSPELVCSLLAVLKNGSVCVPLDPDYPQARLAEMAADAGLSGILARPSFRDRLSSLGIPLIDPETDLIPEGKIQTRRPHHPKPEDPAYLLYTSGSTGRPKAVVIPHRGIIRLVQQPDYAVLDASTVLLMHSSISFDASLFEIWGSLTNGGRLVLLPGRHPGPGDYRQMIREEAINTLFLTTALFNVLIDTGLLQGHSSLKYLLTGGEAASVRSMRAAREQLPSCRILNVYGPTENTTFSTWFEEADLAPDAETVPIGRPVSQTRVYLLDGSRNPVPVGVPGELFVGGAGLADGYLNRPDLTADRFVPDPFRPGTGERLYRTGDLGRYRPDGAIDFLGRMDQQVKIRGYRIEPGEIENVLRAHPNVREALVTVREPVPGDKRLVAYLIPGSGSLSTESVREFLRERLPEYLVPSAWVTLSAFPLTPNGKIDRNALPAPNRQGDLSETGWTPTEKTLAGLWADLLKTPVGGRDDHFFDAGGHSLLAMQLVSRINRRWAVSLRVGEVFDHPTLSGLAARIDRPPAGPGDLPAPIPSRVEGPIPLSFAQKRLWMLHRLYELGGTYNVPLALRLTGPPDLPALERSLTELVRRHPALRLILTETDALPRQQVEAPWLISLPVVDLSGSAEPARNEWLSAEVERPFLLGGDRLFRAALVRLDADRHLLLLVIHHLIVDGWSLQILTSDLITLYETFRQGRPSSLPELRFQYGDYCRWQEQVLTPGMLAPEAVYWQEKLAGLPTLLPLPTDRPRPRVQSFAGAEHGFLLPGPLWRRLRSVTSGQTAFMHLLAVFAVLLHRFAQTEDVVVGSPVAGRDRPEWEPLVGFFVNTLVFRISVNGRRTFRQVLEEVRRVTLDAFSHRTYPFEQLVERLNPPRDLAYSPVVQVVMDLDETAGRPGTPGHPGFEPVPVPRKTAKFDLHLSFRETPEGMEGTFSYPVALFGPETIARLAETYVSICRRVTARPDRPLAEVLGPALSESGIHSAPPGVLLPAEVIPAEGNAPEPTEQEALLAELWKDLFGVSSVGPDDHFFELGGHSLLAIRLVAEIQTRTGIRLPVADLFAHPTLRALAGCLRSASPDRLRQTLVPLRPGKGAAALYFIHPVTGTVDYVHALASAFPESHPVYAFQAVGLDGETPPLTRIEDMAERYLEALLARQPTGPYHLIGYSMGGTIAYEMAGRLKAMGKEVGLIALLDSYPLRQHENIVYDLPLSLMLRNYWNYARRMEVRPQSLWKVATRKLPAATRHFINRFRYYIENQLKTERNAPVADPVPGSSDPVFRANLQAYHAYVFRPAPVKIVFFRATETLADLTKNLPDSDFGWKVYAQAGVDVFTVPGDHLSLIQNRESIRFMAGILNKYLTS
ncbi:non-ribosomal peptide synthetase [Larkinella soli]|uniref:non-ribosomal peptide synthetase n=1 Tax=Larkinella soli TaxID=1770527 RepID=UPI000FFC848D|nr:non-ribosomal peptide synthetase [Larkinella soli]